MHRRARLFTDLFSILQIHLPCLFCHSAKKTGVGRLDGINSNTEQPTYIIGLAASGKKKTPRHTWDRKQLSSIISETITMNVGMHREQDTTPSPVADCSVDASTAAKMDPSSFPASKLAFFARGVRNFAPQYFVRGRVVSVELSCLSGMLQDLVFVM